ncbi:MAG: DUF2203 domain-containing protein [Planctomycetaceae bacterium]
MTIPAPAVRYFSVEEANRTLPLVRMVVQDIVELHRDLQARKERLTELRKRRGSRSLNAMDLYEAELLQMESEVELDIEKLQSFVVELEQVGVELKDPETGVVAFRSMAEGREVFLSWQLGEAEVGYWHEPDEGFPDRQSLLTGTLSPNEFGHGR